MIKNWGWSLVTFSNYWKTLKGYLKIVTQLLLIENVSYYNAFFKYLGIDYFQIVFSLPQTTSKPSAKEINTKLKKYRNKKWKKLLANVDDADQTYIWRLLRKIQNKTNTDLSIHGCLGGIVYTYSENAAKLLIFWKIPFNLMPKTNDTSMPTI